MVFRALVVLGALWAAAATAHAEPLYVDPGGDDRAAGTRAEPLASLAAAIERLADGDTAQEIVLREGVYPGDITIAARKDPPPLSIRAAKRADGSWEDVVFDGSRRIAAAHPVAGKPGVFRILDSSHARDSQGVWEEDTGIRYRRLADTKAVERVPASFVIADGRLFFHTSDGRPPSVHRIGSARDRTGIRVRRRRVTLQGLQFRHFVLERRSAAIRVDAGDVTIEDCRIWNARRGIYRGPTPATAGGLRNGTDEHDLRVRRCRADHVGTGFFGQGGVSGVEDSQFFYRPGPFEVTEDSQDQSGIQSYSPARGATVRGNLLVGFNSGIFFKSTGTDYVVEHDTIVGTGSSAYGMGRTHWPGHSAFHHNIVTGFRRPILTLDPLPPDGTIVDNLIWWPAAKEPRPGRSVQRLAQWLDQENVNASPRFVDPSRDDYRLLPESPGTRMGPGGLPIGALGSASDLPAELLPPVVGAQLEASSFDWNIAIGLRRIEPTFVRHTGPPRAWYVDPSGGADKPAVGTREHPLRTLQLALDRANPGDRVVLLPGLYLGTHVLAHGGTGEAPIVIEASPAGRAVLDGLKSAAGKSILTIRDAPHVVVRGLEVRWFRSIQFGREAAGISIEGSPHVEVRDCEIWNAPWINDRATGIGIRAVGSPHLVVDGCTLYALDNGLVVKASPSFRVTHNTVAMAFHHGAKFIDSVQGSRFEGNSFAFAGSHLVAIRATPEQMASFRSDYNNLGANLRDLPQSQWLAPGRDSGVSRSDLFGFRRSKAVGFWNGRPYVSLDQWRKATRQEAHSIFEHPRYTDPEHRDFRPLPGSPNLGTAEDGGPIGARGLARPPQGGGS